MTAPKENSEFCFPEANPKETLRVEAKQNSLLSSGTVIRCFVIPPTESKRSVTLLFLWLETIWIYSMIFFAFEFALKY